MKFVKFKLSSLIDKVKIANISFDFKNWCQENFVGLFILNIVIIFLELLRSAGYFTPYFTITINFIVFVGLVGASIFLRIKSNVILILVLFFWLLALGVKIIHINIWAERVADYAFDALVVGLILFIIE